MRKNDTARPALLDPLLVLSLLSRLPLPRIPDAAYARQAHASWAFPLAGAIIGAVAAVAGLGALWLGLPVTIAAGCVIGVQVIATGAMHEDGLADTCDGLWGGWTRERRLQIMKDSSIGTYGVLALILSVGLRWIALVSLLPLGFAPVIAAAVLSRAVLPVLMTALPHARSDGLSRSVGVPRWWTAVMSVAIGISLAWLAVGPLSLIVALIVAAPVAGLAAIAQSRIGGQTGDILGAAQQLGEISVLLSLLVFLPL